MSALSKFKITTPIRELLLADPEIVKMVKKKIYPLVAPQDIAGDFILYQRDEYSKEYNKMGITSQKCNVFIVAVSEDYDRSQHLAYLINEALDGHFPDLKITIKLIDSSEEFGEGKYIQLLLYSIE